MSHRILCQSEALAATEFAGFIRSIETHPGRWNWPQSTLDYCRYRLAELAGDLLATDTGTAVTS